VNEEQRQALSAVQFSWAVAPDDIWNPLPHHVDGLHPRATGAMTNAVSAARRAPGRQPIGLVLRGERGVGKTHLLGWFREHVQAQGGAFFLLKMLDERTFWAGAVHGVVTGLLRPGIDQLGQVLDFIAESTGVSSELHMRLRGTIPVSRTDLDELVTRVGDLDPRLALECQDTLRALVLYRAKGRPGEVGHSFLVLGEGIDDEDRRQWGFRSASRASQLLLNDLSRIFALAGPVVMAIDQIDPVLTESPDETGRRQLADRLANGLMRLREESLRTILVVACIGSTWELIDQHAVNSAADRFRVLDLRTAMPDRTIAATIVERHLGTMYGEIGFTPPYPSWPVLPAAFDDPNIAHFSPRRLLRVVDEHVRRCLENDELRELVSFSAEAPAVSTAPSPSPSDLVALDELFEQRRIEADVVSPLDQDHEDDRMPALLGAALHCYVLERGRGGQQLTIDPAPGVKPALHARLRQTLDEAHEDEVHWGFRAISHEHHTAVLTKLRSAMLEAQLAEGAPKRKLVVIRNFAFSGGPRTQEVLAELEAAGGLRLTISADDLRTFSALESLLAKAPPGFQRWLLVRQPASRSALLSYVLPTEPSAEAAATADERTRFTGDLPSPAAAPSSSTEPVAPRAQDQAAIDEPAVVFGTDVEHGRNFSVPLLLLRKHSAVFAGSGSGKTVLLRRMIEQVALRGVSTILIDTNNDLARLGDPWPAPPEGWLPGDAEDAQRYLDGTNVVIWTPRREAGRPLALNPLPDFRGVQDDQDEFRMSIDAAVAGLIPRAGLTRSKMATGKAVLTQALTGFARNGGDKMPDFVAYLGDLPDGISTIRNAPRIAGDMAEELKAAMINDPLFGGAGEHLDPAVLLTPPPGKRARISVISCIGMPTDEQRQTFMNQLQLALFGWVKQNPAGDRPLGGLLVLDEAQTFIPARGTTASSASTLQLATQARKYGLGLVYATQAPKALHNLVTGNAATQFFGLLNASAQIQAATELARKKGGRVDDISRLPAGRFYGATEGGSFAKLQIPMCLSHHPASALTEEEVLRRARNGRNSDA
jgi:hypothetical protein